MPPKRMIQLPWPRGGVVEGVPEAEQPQGSTPDALNVRNYGPIARRNRGGQRVGLTKFIDAQPNGSNSIQTMKQAVEAVPLSTEAAIGSEYADSASGFAIAFQEGDIAFHPTAEYAAIATTGSPFIAVYNFTIASGWGTKLSNPSTLPPNDGKRTDWHPDGDYIALAGQSSGAGTVGFNAWAFDPDAGSFGSKLSDPSGLPDDSTAYDVHWHPTGDYVAVAHGTAGDKLFVWPFDKANGTFGSKITIPSIPGGTLFTVRWSPDGTVLAAGNTSDPKIHAWKFDPDAGSFDSKYSDPTTVASGDVFDLSWHPDGTYLAAAPNITSGPEVYGWDNSTGFGSQLTDDDWSSSGTRVVNFAPSGNFLLVGGAGSPYVNVYPWSAGFGTALNPSSGLSDTLNLGSGGWHPSEEAFGVVSQGGGYFHAFGFTTADTNPSARVNRLIVVSGGNIYYTNSPPSQYNIASGGTGKLRTTGIVRAGVSFQKVFFADGKADSYHYLDLSDKQVYDWSSNVTAGSLPVGSSDATVACRIIAIYRGRAVLSGMIEDPQNWFMSKAGDPFDWNYSPSTPSATQAVAGNNAEAGKVGDIVTCLAPYQDDVMVMGGANSLWIMRGDPAAGGQIDNLSRTVGVAGPEAWAFDNSGNFYFFGVNGMYRLPAGSTAPELLSAGRLDKTFDEIDTSQNNIRMVYDSTWQGVHIFVQPFTEPNTAPKHYWWDQRNDAFWPDQYPKDHGPVSMIYFNADNSENSGVLIGGWDGYVRRFDPDANADDGTVIDSYVLWAPIQPGNVFASARATGLWLSTAKASDDITADIFVGDTPEVARDNADAGTSRVRKTIKGGRNTPLWHRIAQNALIVKLSQNGNGGSGATWAYEQGGVQTEILNRMRGRRVS